LGGDHLRELTELVLRFRDERDWKQFHTPKDLALSLSLEAAEVLELFQWKNGEELEKHLRENRQRLGEELSDVLYWLLLMAHDNKIDLSAAFRKKMRQNEKKYPAAKSKGSSKKYTEL
jgi:NTP pyrophosphatase (non-canonical NTP hydrolase)